MQMQIQLCKEIGVPVRDLELIEIYQVAGRIIDDEALRQKAMKYLDGSILPPDARQKAIDEMKPAERAELFERVMGVLPIKRKP
jgi:hypothetical protein